MRGELDQPSWSCDWGQVELAKGRKGVLRVSSTPRKMFQIICRFQFIKIFLAQFLANLELWARGCLGASAERAGCRGLASQVAQEPGGGGGRGAGGCGGESGWGWG